MPTTPQTKHTAQRRIDFLTSWIVEVQEKAERKRNEMRTTQPGTPERCQMHSDFIGLRFHESHLKQLRRKAEQEIRA